jgi:hypothetical protein
VIAPTARRLGRPPVLDTPVSEDRLWGGTTLLGPGAPRDIGYNAPSGDLVFYYGYVRGELRPGPQPSEMRRA